MIIFMRRAARLLVLWLGVLIASPGVAQIEVCNESRDYRYGVALAYWSARHNEVVSVGWLVLEPGVCQTAIHKLESNAVLLHARFEPAGRLESSGNPLLDIFQLALAADMMGTIEGDRSFCGRVEPFLIVGLQRCNSRSFEILRARQYDTSEARKVLFELYDGNKVRWNTW